MSNQLQFGNKVAFINGLPFTLPVATSNPGSGVAGDMYYNSTSNVVKYYNGSTWDVLLPTDGSAAITGNLNLNSNKITNLAAGTTSSDAVNYGQVILANGANAFSASQSMGGFKLTNLANGSLANDAVTYGQLTSLSLGLIWQGPINDPDLVDDSLSTPPISPIFSLTYIIAGSPTGAWAGCAGHATWWDGAQWIDLSTGTLLTSGQGTPVQVGARFLIAAVTFQGPAHVGGSFAGGTHDSQVATVLTNTPGSFTYSFATPASNWAVADLTSGSQHYNSSFTYATVAPYTFTVSSANATAGAVYTNNGQTFTVNSTIVAGTSLLVSGTGAPSASGTLTKSSGAGDATITFSSYTGSNWIDFAGPGKSQAGNALAYTGNTLNVLFDGVTLDLTGNQLEVKTGGISNAQINAAAAIAYSKLSLSNSIVNTDINSAAAISYSKLNLSSSIVNADISATAAIAYSKLNLTGNIINADISASAAIAFSKLASLTSANILVGNGTNVATSVAVSGDLTLANTGAFTVAKIQSTTVSGTTGSGNVVFSASPILTGTITAAAANFSGAISATNFRAASAGDLTEASFSAANNQSAAADVTGLTFANATVRAASILLSVYVNATSSLYETFNITLIQKGASWNIAQTSVGDASGFVFSITAAGQIQYTSSNYSGFVSATLKFRAITTTV